jgi:hypothetical protein
MHEPQHRAIGQHHQGGRDKSSTGVHVEYRSWTALSRASKGSVFQHPLYQAILSETLPARLDISSFPLRRSVAEKAIRPHPPSLGGETHHAAPARRFVPTKICLPCPSAALHRGGSASISRRVGA